MILLFWSMILSLSLSRCVYACVSVSFFFYDLWVFLHFWSMILIYDSFFFSDLWFFLLFWSTILSSFLIYYSFSLSLSLSQCVYVCVSVSFFFSDLWFFLRFWSMILSSFLEILSQWVLLQLQYRKKKEEGEKKKF